MNAHRAVVRLDTAAALVDRATAVLARIARVAPYAAPQSRLRLMDELALVENVLDGIEHFVRVSAQGVLDTVPERATKLPKREQRKRLPAFVGGRGVPRRQLTKATP